MSIRISAISFDLIYKPVFSVGGIMIQVKIFIKYSNITPTDSNVNNANFYTIR